MDDKRIIRQILNENNLTISPIIGRGDVNRVYLVDEKDKRVVIRLNEKTELARFQKEAWCLERAEAQGIPSPQLLNIGIEDNTAFMVLNFVPGKNGKDITEDQDKVWQVIGSYAKKINSVSVQGFGERMISAGNFDDTWERYLDYNIDSLNPTDKLLQLGTFTEIQSKSIKEQFLKLKEKHFNFGLVHGDLSLENIIVNNDQVTLIDWGTAEATIVPHLEIVDLLQNQILDSDPLFNSFLQGYGMTINEYQSIKPEIETLTLLQAIDKLRWAIDKKPEKIVEFSQRVKSLVQN